MVAAADLLPLLVTGAGAPGIRGTLYALRHNPDRRLVRIIGVDVDEEAVGRYLVDQFHVVPAPENPGYLDRLREICYETGARIILPQTTREVARLSQCRDVLARDGIAVMVSDADAVAVANDKAALMAKFKQLGLPAPRFRLAASETALLAAVHDLGYPKTPVVVKPPVSNGMRGVRVLRDHAWDVERFLKEKPSGTEISLLDLLQILRCGRWPELVVMEYLPGIEYSVDAFLGERFEVAVPRRREAIRSGITFRSRTEFNDCLVRATLEAARALGLQYAFGFQFKLDAAGVPKVLECNPRIQGTMVASAFSGAHVIWFGVRELAGEPVSGLAAPLCPSRFLRFWGGIGLAAGITEEI